MNETELKASERCSCSVCDPEGPLATSINDRSVSSVSCTLLHTEWQMFTVSGCCGGGEKLLFCCFCSVIQEIIFCCHLFFGPANERKLVCIAGNRYECHF